MKCARFSLIAYIFRYTDEHRYQRKWNEQKILQLILFIFLVESLRTMKIYAWFISPFNKSFETNRQPHVQLMYTETKSFQREVRKFHLIFGNDAYWLESNQTARRLCSPFTLRSIPNSIIRFFGDNHERANTHNRLNWITWTTETFYVHYKRKGIHTQKRVKDNTKWEIGVKEQTKMA